MKQWCYWDGQIIKGPDGKFHMFASRWDQARGHNGWFGSVAVHAVADRVTGPYVDKGLLWPDNHGGKGHNVTALVLPDGRYAVVVSETRPGDVFVSKSLDGPWEHLEDPVVWRSGGLYHIVVNGWSDRKAYHITSADGITNWTLRGLAFDPRRDVVRYTNAVVNHWDKMERPGVLIENGHVTAFTLAVLRS